MNNKLICPYCNKQLQPTLRQSDEYWCENCECQGTTVEWFGSQKLWQELIRTGKALDKAKNGLKELRDIIACPPDVSYETGASMYADGVLQEITTLEQKE